MNVCNYCGVELDVEMNYCPLCGHKSNIPVVKSGKPSKAKDLSENLDEFNFEALNLRQKRKVIWELGAFMLLLTSIVTLIIDLLTSKHVSWSKYTMTIGMILLIDISLLLLVQKKIYLILIGCFLSTSLLLFLLDVYTQNIDNGLTIGIPILFFIFLVLFFLTILIQRTKQKGVNIIAYGLVAAGLICMSIEGIISLHLYTVLRFQWSTIVLVSVLPVSAILLYIHYRLKRATNLKNFFNV